jgi:4'-phosphopantetheinyl transferase
MKTGEPDGFRLENDDNAGERQRLSLDEIAVWLCRVERLNDIDLAAMESVLSEEERARRDRFVFAEDRRAFTAAHALLRTALSRYGSLPPRAWRFGTTFHGKPFLPPAQTGAPPLKFNMSHTRRVVACAIALGTAVGIDVEGPERLADGVSIAERHFTGPELQLLTECAPEDVNARFVEIWTLKEAYLKATGLGLSLALDSFGFAFADAFGLTFTGPADAARWQFWLAALSDTTRIAVAAAANPRNLSWRVSWWEHDGSPASGVALLRCSTR